MLVPTLVERVATHHRARLLTRATHRRRARLRTHAYASRALLVAVVHRARHGVRRRARSRAHAADEKVELHAPPPPPLRARLEFERE